MKRLASLLFAALCLAPPASAATRIKDITSVIGVRENQLVGYGLVLGLAGTGDSLRGSPFTEQSLRSMLERMGVSVPPNAMKARNVAAVVVTATLPPFISKGSRIDVSVSSLGDASSLLGGMLLLTPLVAVDGKAYAVAQGPVSVTGFSVAGASQSITQGTATGGRIANGALIERQIEEEFNAQEGLALQVFNADFATVTGIADAINAYSDDRFGEAIATARDPRTVVLKRPADISATRLLAEIGVIPVEPDMPARVVVDEKAGTVIISGNSRLSKVAVTHGSLSVRITDMPAVSQPPPLSPGETVVVEETEVITRQDGGQLSVVNGPTLEKLVDGLNRLGVKPAGIIAILEALKTSGALHAELVVQ